MSTQEDPGPQHADAQHSAPRTPPRGEARCQIVGPDAEALRDVLGRSFNLLRHAPTYKDDQRCLDASGDVIELPDGTFKLRAEE
ncbi:hypothetical protein [Azoarcus sp. CIB]|uniref:hypothetical protein n=1 Tax=Aromatoleum sp. (strain CIB) TaxID=198107 RepID=UPI00067B0879|nr:hypothetical protein [Azoarcus sp. CIB]